MTGGSEGSRQGPVVDPAAAVPLYHQVFLLLHQRILDGTYPLGSTLPSEAELCRRFGVSRITVKRACDEMVKRGLVSRRRGLGTMVRFEAPLPSLQTNFDSLLHNLQEMGQKTRLKLLEFDYRPAEGRIAEALQIEPGAPVQYAVRTRSLASGAFSCLVTHLPEQVGRLFDADALRKTPMLDLLVKHGVQIAGARQEITAVLADPVIASALELEVGSALIMLRRVLFDRDERPVQHITCYYRPDRYQYRMVLQRVDDEGGGRWELSS